MDENNEISAVTALSVSAGDVGEDFSQSSAGFAADGLAGSSVSGLSSSVSSGDIQMVQETPQSALLYSVGYSDDFETAALDALTSIDGKMSLLVFLMLLFWCLERVKNAVRSFTGRGLHI